MKLLPDRNADRPGNDPIFALNAQAQQRKAKGDKVINGTVGALLEDDGTLAVLPTVMEALRSVPAQKAASYAPIAGDVAFLDAVRADLLGSSSLLERSVSAATPGGTGALRHAVSIFSERGQALVTSSFYWGPYGTIADEHERRVVTFNMFAGERDALRLDVEAMSRTLDEVATAQGRLLVFLNDPCHNPTGYSMSASEWEATRDVLVRCSERVPTTVVADVAYLAFAKDTKGFLRYLEPVAEAGVLCFAWSGSKGFGLYGQRVGALIACTRDDAQRAAVQRALSYACRGTWSNCNASGMDAVRRCLTDPALDPKVREERARLTALLDRRVRAFNAAARGTKLSYPRYDGGFFVTVFARDPKRSMDALIERGVFVVPGPGSLRVALCSVAEADVPPLVAALDECV